MRMAVLPSAPGAPRCKPRRLSLILLAAFLAGCSGSRPNPVNATRAREALETTLNGWKNGDTPERLQSASPSIVAQDLDWIGGAKLVAYHVSGDGKPVEANLFVPVDLTLRMANGKQVKKSVTYVVGTSPYLSVLRALK